MLLEKESYLLPRATSDTTVQTFFLVLSLSEKVAFSLMMGKLRTQTKGGCKTIVS